LGRRSIFQEVNPPLEFYSEHLGSLSGCVLIYFWFVIARRLGLYHPLSPCWRRRQKASNLVYQLQPIMKQPRKPPDKYKLHRAYLAFYFLYLFVVFLNTNAVRCEEMSVASLSAMPLTLFFGFTSSYLSTVALKQRLYNSQALHKLFNPVVNTAPTDPFSREPGKPIFATKFDESTNADKLAMLCAWQTANSKTPIYMDYAPGSKAICIDTGASACISNDKNDFISLEKVECQTIKGIGEGIAIAGHGTLRWSINDDEGNAIILHVRDALYVPKVPMCLLSPQQVAQQTNKSGDGFHTEAQFGKLTYDGFARTVLYNSLNNLPIVFTTSTMCGLISPFQTEAFLPHATCKSSYVAALLSSAVAGTVENLTRTQRLLLLVHESMAHLNLDHVQRLARDGYFGETLKCIGTCTKPLCRACCTGKAHQRAKSKTGTPLKTNHLKPGDCISCDQLQSNTPGKIPVWKGSPSKDSYGAASFFVDHASDFVNISLHHSTGAMEAVTAKHRFEKLAADFGVKISKYHGDNGVYATKLFKDSCSVFQQDHDFCGVNAHHQNGIAERMIGTITRRARTMLLHATILWPDIITEDLWPFALTMAAAVHNATPGPSGLSPEEIFSGTKSSRNRLKDFHPFGCPVFVLESSLQQGHKIPKWKPRSRMAVYLGHSPEHATSVPIVLNTITGLVSPQFHVVFDDAFTTTNHQKPSLKSDPNKLDRFIQTL
jgi:hypothetical protein